MAGGADHEDVAAGGVARGVLHGDTWGDFVGTGVDDGEPVGVAGGFHSRDAWLCVVRGLDEGVPVGSSADNLRFGEVGDSVGGDPADVVGVQVGEDHGVDVGGVAAERSELVWELAAFGEERGRLSWGGGGGGHSFGVGKQEGAQPGVDQDGAVGSVDEEASGRDMDSAVRVDAGGRGATVQAREEQGRQAGQSVAECGDGVARRR